MSADQVPIVPASRIANHWYSRIGWRPGRLFDTWHLVFDGLPQVHDLAARCWAALDALPGLNVVPAEWLHMTIQGVGWSDELADDERDAVVRHVIEELSGIGECDIQLGPPLVKGEALVLPATPVDYLNQLRNRLRVAIEKALGRTAWDAAEQVRGFQPHVSFAYANRDADAAPYAIALSAVSPETVRVPIRHVAFIRQERQFAPHWRYVWEDLARLPLGS